MLKVIVIISGGVQFGLLIQAAVITIALYSNVLLRSHTISYVLWSIVSNKFYSIHIEITSQTGCRTEHLLTAKA